MGAKLASLSGVLGATQDRGLTFITSSTFSAASTVAIDNCFTSAYDSYLVTGDCVAGASVVLRLRLRASGADISTSTYSIGVGGWNQSGGTESHSVASAAAINLGYVSTLRAALAINVINPNLAQHTQFNGTAQVINTADTAYLSVAVGGVFYTATVADGIVLYPSSSTITGRLSVYGYRLT